MSLTDSIDPATLAGMSREDRLRTRKELLARFLKSDQAAGSYFLSQDEDGRDAIKEKFYSRLNDKNPDFGRYLIRKGEVKMSAGIATAGPGAPGVPVRTRTPDTFGQLFDDRTEYLYDAVDKGLVAAGELDQDTTVFLSGLMHRRGSTKAKELQARAQEIAKGYGIGEGYAKFGGLTSGPLKPIGDIAAWAAEKVGTDTSERDRTHALLAAAYPDRVPYENWGKVLGLLGGSVLIYTKLGQRGLSTVVTNEAGKRRISKRALAATGAAEFGLGYAYNTPTLMVGGDDPSRVMSGIEAMFLGSALNLAIDAVLPLRGMNQQQAVQHLDELNPPKWKEVREGIFANADEAPPSPQNIAIAEQMRDAQIPGRVPLNQSLDQAEAAGRSFNELQGDMTAKSLQDALESNQLPPASSTPISEGAGPAVTPEMGRIREIDDHIHQLNQREAVLKERRGLSKKERATLNAERKSLANEKVQLQYAPAMTKHEQMAEEALPGSVLGITPYIREGLGEIGKDELQAQLMKELMLRGHVGAITAMHPDGEEIGRTKAFMYGFIAGDPRAWKSLGKALPSGIGKGASHYLEPLDQRIQKISPTVYNALNRMELRISTSMKDNFDQVVPFFQKLQELKRAGVVSKADIEELTLATFNRDVAARDAVFQRIDRTGDLAASYGKIDNMLKNLHDQAKASGMDIKFLQDYYPRILLNYKGLLKGRGWKETDAFTKEVRKFEAESKRKATSQERADIANKLILRNSQNPGPSYTKERKLDTLEVGDLKHYASMEDALGGYIYDIVRRIEKRNFTGAAYKPGQLVTKKTPLGDKYKVRTMPKDQQSVVGDTLGAEVDEFVDILRASGHIEDDHVNDLVSMLNARLVHGDVGPTAAVAAYRNIHYLTTIGNPFSTLTQVSDIAMAATKNASATGNVLGQALKGKGFDFTPEDLGLVHVAEDMMNRTMTAKWLDNTLKTTGFKGMDRLGKATHLSSAYQRFRKAALAPEDSALFKQFKKEQQPRFGDEFEDLVAALRNGDKSNENVKLAVFNELSGIQPITLSSMPEGYLRGRNTRLAYALKSFTIKQVDFMRREMLGKIAKAKTPAEVKEGMANLYRYVALFGGTTMGVNTLKDFILGREINVDDATADAWMQTMGLSRYSIYQARDFWQKEDSAAGTAKLAGSIVLPVRALGDVVDDAIRLGKGDMQGFQDISSVRNVPWAGKGVYWRFGEGREKIRKRRVRNAPKSDLGLDMGQGGVDLDF